MDYYTTNENTGNAPQQPASAHRPVTEKEKVELWYIEPLRRMRGDEAFVCLMVCFPLLETIIRHELAIPDDQDVTLSDDSPALQWFATFMTIPQNQAREIWDAFRNGLLHRAMIKGSVRYELTGKTAGRPATVNGGVTTVYVWDFRNEVMRKLEQHHRKLWRGGQNSLPGIYVTA
jgi:hypothetical protein